MAEAHPTTTPKQAQTDEMAVFQMRTMRSGAELPVLLGTIEIPRYTVPTNDGVRLDRDKRIALAAHRVAHDMLRDPSGEFMVSDSIGEMETVEYEENPTFDVIWNPNGGGA